jgi:3-mercaptopyruvate sulfurtransferase SseA
LEMLAFLETSVAQGTGLVIDSRLPDWFAKGTIPAAVNVPFATLDATNPYRTEILQALGATGAPDDLDFSGAFELVLFSNGPWDDQASRAILNLLDAGYPPEKLHYYRGGMQDWLLLGLTVTMPEQAG